MADVVNYLMLVSLMCLLLGVGLRTAFGAVFAVAQHYRIVAKVDELRRCVIGWERTLLWVMKPAAAR